MSVSTPDLDETPIHFIWERTSDETDLLRWREAEWIITDGCGGFAMGTPLGLCTRRYHSYLNVPLRPPVGRLNTLTMLVERLTLNPGTENAKRFELTPLEFKGTSFDLRTMDHLRRFEKLLNEVRWTWDCDGVIVIRTLSLGWRGGGASVRYECFGRDDVAVRLEIAPLVRLDDYHHLTSPPHDRMNVESTETGLSVKNGDGPTLHLTADRGTHRVTPDWWYQFHYEEEAKRGQDHVEDLFSPGWFELTMAPGQSDRFFTLQARLEVPSGPEKCGVATGRTVQLMAIQKNMAKSTPNLARQADLLLAADDFVVPRLVDGHQRMTILAGYPWFADWGRDTMISLPGLLLATRRFDEALATLETFASHRKNGLVPNRFDDYDGPAHYNTVDASLWFLHAACEYRRSSGDTHGFDVLLKDACFDIIDHFRKGTDFNIAMDRDDGLISAGDESTQLTWMDAKRDGVTFTPRHGKAVEINALWYHGLRSVAEAVGEGEPDRAVELNDLADRVGASFIEQFWCGDDIGLADTVRGGDGGEVVPDRSVRPNQIFAVSLRHSPLNQEQKRTAVNVVRDQLLTPRGLRTLSPRDSRYHGRFKGSMFHRDSAYHQGTVWPWLLGPYVEALLRSESFSEPARAEAYAILDGLLEEMRDGPSIGQLYEVYDGDDSPDQPRAPGGCPAQAWSVAALLSGYALLEGEK